jgi:hypothetical protein
MMKNMKKVLRKMTNLGEKIGRIGGPEIVDEDAASTDISSHDCEARVCEIVDEGGVAAS